MTNLIQNAVDSISDSPKRAGGFKIEVAVFLSEKDILSVSVSDNGKGLPSEDRERLTEPYITTREKGTGLGLAIVRKIMEDHGGEVRLQSNSRGEGATVSLVFTSSGFAALGTNKSIGG